MKAALAFFALAAAQEVTEPGTGSASRHAYFVMVGPMEPQRRYRPWLASATAMANALRAHGGGADVLVLLAARRDGARRPSVRNEPRRNQPRRRGRGAAAAATWIVRGDGSRRRCDVDSPRRRIAATLRRG